MDQSLTSPVSIRHCWTTDDIKRAVEESEVVVFSRGPKESPYCGYCKEVISLLSDIGLDYKVVDISQEATIKPALRSFSGHHEVPLVYANGELISCSDTLQHLVESGNLESQLRSALVK